MKNSSVWPRTGLMFLSAGAAGPLLAQSADSVALEEVVVTATKREASLHDVPLSMQAFTGSSLERIGADQIDDFYRMVPNFAVVDNGPGGRQYSIRGISSGLVTQGASTVGVYIDEMPVSAASFQPDPQLFDIERVEVLRGPQGTLYGEGSIGGTLRMITKQPDLTAFSAIADGTFSATEKGSDNYAIRGMLNLPLVEDKLALRLTAQHDFEGGYIDRIAQPNGVILDMNQVLGLPPGTIPLLGTPPIAAQSNINDVETTSGRASLRWQATENLAFTTSFLAQHMKADDRPTEVGGVGELQTNFITPENVDDKFRLANLTITYEAPWATFLSTTSQFKRDVRDISDTTALGGAVFPGVVLPGSATDTIEHQDMFSQELRLTSKGDGRLQWLAGAFYVDKDNGFDQDLLDSSGVFVGFVNILGVPATDPGQLLDQTGWNQEEQFALFGEVSYDITSKLTGTIGLRYFDIDQHNVLQNNDVNFLGLGLTDGVRDTSESDTIMRANLSYTASDDLLFWATASQGFRTGGTNTTPGIDPEDAAYDSDTLWNYEVGARLSALDNRLAISTGLYYIDWTDIQLSLPLGTARGTVNAGEARIIGAEVEISARPIEALTLTLNAGYNDGELTQDTPDAPNGPNPGFKGDRLPGVPDLNFAASAQYSFPLGTRGLSGFIRGDYTFTGDMTTTFNDLSTANGLPSHFNPDSYDLINARFGIESERWSASLFVNNLTDERAQVLVDNAAIAHRITRNRPRTIGINVRVDF